MKRSDLVNKFASDDESARREFVRAALATNEGKIFFWWLLRSFGSIGEQPFTGERGRTDFNCGRLEAGNTVLGEIIFSDPAALPGLMTEMFLREKSRQDELNDAKENDDD